MCDWLNWISDVVASVDWFELLKAVAPLLTVWIAWRALKNWQRQDRAKAQAQFLDELVESTHRMIEGAHTPILAMGFAQVGMVSHRPPRDSEATADDWELAGAIALIAAGGEDYAAQMQKGLDAIAPTFDRLRALQVKGWVFRFEDYDRCLKALHDVQTVVLQLQSFAAMISSTSTNWEHPTARQGLLNVSRLDPEVLSGKLQAAKAAIVDFSTNAYRRIYGK